MMFRQHISSTFLRRAISLLWYCNSINTVHFQGTKHDDVALFLLRKEFLCCSSRHNLNQMFICHVRMVKRARGFVFWQALRKNRYCIVNSHWISSLKCLSTLVCVCVCVEVEVEGVVHSTWFSRISLELLNNQKYIALLLSWKSVLCKVLYWNLKGKSLA
jgi:hypothetical protein